LIETLDLLERLLREAEKTLVKSTKRKSFSQATKHKVLAQQNFSCAFCKEKLKAKDFDHIDGDNSNNSLDNCQALCPNCHAKKTRHVKNRKLRLSHIVKNINHYVKLMNID